jgi:diketogulonate reductase-like aldo/keto reductase
MVSMSTRTTRLAGIDVPLLGQGTWRMGDDPTQRRIEVEVLRSGVDWGLTLIDTAELYADGEAEAIVGEAIQGLRDDVFIVSKVLPTNATADGTVKACEASLRRLGTDRIDLYLLHWRREIPLTETVEGFRRLLDAGKIRAWGVSNFSVGDLDDLPEGSAPAADQVLYNLTRRGPEADLIPRCAAEGICFMAYSPIEKGRLLDQPQLVRVARERGATPAQVALAWTVRSGDVIAVPKASSPQHLRENADALHLRLSDEELDVLDRAFPAPGIVPLETLS